jgi:putative ABC transport system permease protein
MNNPLLPPPRIASFLLKKLVLPEIRSGAMEDFTEQFNWIYQNRGRWLAIIWYWTQILHLFPGFLRSLFYWRAIMFTHNFKLCLRNIKRHKIFTLINVFGLAVGLACCMLLLLWVQDELSYDRFHEHGKHIYRIIEKNQYDTGISYSAITPAPVAPLIKSQVPEVTDFARFWPETLTLKFGEKNFSLHSGIIDPSFLKIFSFPLVKGDQETCLTNPTSILLTEESAEKIFGNEDPLGKTLLFEGKDVAVTGIIADIPRNSHLQFACLVPLSLAQELGINLDNWAYSRYFSYVQLNAEALPSAVNGKIKNLAKTHAPGGSQSELQLQPFTKIYLYGLNSTGPIAYVYIFSLVAFFNLLLAGINFINLTTARSSQRAKEIGLKKVVGAKRWQIIRQLLSETLFLTLASLALALFMVILVLPAFNQLSGKQISLNIQNYPEMGLGLILVTILTGLLAGSYPAFFLSSFKPVNTLKGISYIEVHGGAPRLRKALVIFQFALSIALIICTTVINSQMNYMRNRDLGIDIADVVCVPVDNLEEDYATLKAELRQNPNILHVTASSFPLASYAVGTSAAEWEGKEKGERISMGLAMVDFDTFDTFKLKMAAGRPFQKEFATDATEAYVMNETAVLAMGLQDPIGKRFSWNQRDGRIIGVVKDFHNRSLHQEIQPFVFLVSPSWFRYLSIKINPAANAEALNFLRDKWKELRPGQDFSNFFLDSYIDRFYRSEQRMEKVLQYFTFIAIFISCLGLFGLTTFSAGQRTKEIGIRKVLGASVSRIIIMLSQDFTKRVLLANIIAWPVAYYFMHSWLQNFAYRTRIDIWVFFMAGALAMLIALLTVSYQSIRAALADPVDSLRYE